MKPQRKMRNTNMWKYLVVMGGDSCWRGFGFESEHQKLVGHFSQQIGEKRQCLLEKDQKMNEKDAGNALFLKHVKYKKGKRVLNEIVKYGTT